MSDGLTFSRWLRWRFLRCSGGSGDVLFGIKIYGNRYFDKAWFKNTVYQAYRVARRIHEARYWVLYRTTKRDLWTVRTGLHQGYYDCDTLMLHACMSLLCRYVEDECGGDKKLEKWTADLLVPGSEGHGPREYVDAQAENQGGAVAIYRWWKVLRPVDEARRDFLTHELYGKRRISFKKTDNQQLSESVFDEMQGNESAMRDELWALEDKISKDEQTMLHRLIDIRQGLWT